MGVLGVIKKQLVVFDKYDRLALAIDLTPEQCNMLDHILPASDPEHFGAYPVPNVFFECVRVEE